MYNKITKNAPIAVKIGIVALPMPFIIIFSAFFFVIGVLALIYSIVICIAWKSAMSFLLLFGSGLIMTGFGLMLVYAFYKYYQYFRVKTGLLQQKSHKQFKYDSAKPGKDIDQRNKTDNSNISSVENINSNLSLKQKIYKFFGCFNVACIFAVIGTILVVISAFLGSVNRAAWIDAKGSYMRENGYFVSVKVYDSQSFVEENNDVITKINICLNNKNAVVIYTESADAQDTVRMKGYISYERQIVCTKGDNGTTLIISETPSPKQNRPIDKMLYFLFNENKAERQLRVYIPSSLRDDITVTGNYILALN